MNIDPILLNRNIFGAIIVFLAFFVGACSPKTDFTVSSPDGQIQTTLLFNKEQGTINYKIQSRGKEIILSSPVGISTSRGEFNSAMKLKGHSEQTIDETYNLPQGKVSTYRNHANEQTITFSKSGQNINILFRVYNDGVAFCFEIPGKGQIEFFQLGF